LLPAYGLVHIGRRELELGGGLGHSEQLVARVGSGADWRLRSSDHPGPEGSPELLEGAQHAWDVFHAKVGHPPRVRRDLSEIRWPVDPHESL
jgi:hypothetical protein